jgi:hypothetical protein
MMLDIVSRRSIVTLGLLRTNKFHYEDEAEFAHRRVSA